MTLPAAASNLGRVYVVKRLGGAGQGCTVAGVAAADGGDFPLDTLGNSGNAITVQSDGTNWYVITQH